jgi:hypothetical protein
VPGEGEYGHSSRVREAHRFSFRATRSRTAKSRAGWAVLTGCEPLVARLGVTRCRSSFPAIA